MKIRTEKSVVVSLSLLSAICAGTSHAATYAGPPGGPASAAENEAIYQQYCTGSSTSTDIPEVNYANAEVQAAIAKMVGVKDKNYYFYRPVLAAYKLGKNGALTPPPANAPKELTPGGHAFLVQLCGEFRDRATLIRERIQWLGKLYKLPVTIPTAYDPSGDPWAQMSAHWYQPYTSLASQYREALKAELGSQGKNHVAIGKYPVEDAPVAGTDGCETKYMFSEYISQNKTFTNLADFRAGYEPFKAKYCTSDDVSFYYDFRGDKNFKQNSPEGNAMIWTASSIVSQCDTPTKVKAGSPLSDQDCINYFLHPFLTRWKGARAGLATWLFRDSKYNTQFETENGNLTMLFNPKDLDHTFHFLMAGVTGEINENLPEFANVADPFTLGDLGFNQVTGLSVLASTNWNMDLQFERLRDALNTHTNWYGSGYDDKLPGGMKQTQFYSPFVASSYVMEASDGFASEQDGSRKAWMFVFKVKKDKWYNLQSVIDRKPVDFDTMWLDESSIGTQGYAKSERAFDRMGTSIEGEHVAILYLHNIYGGQVISDDLSDEEIQKQQEAAQHQLNPAVKVDSVTLTSAEGVSLKLEFQGAPQCYNQPQPNGTFVQTCSYNPFPLWLTVTGSSVTAKSVIEASLSYQYPAQPGQPVTPPQIQKFALDPDATSGGQKGFALGWGEDAYQTTVSLNVKVDGKPLTFASVLDFKAITPPPPAPSPVPVPLPSPAPTPVGSPVPVPSPAP